MRNLSDATAKGRKNTAGCTKLAVFFLVCLFFFCGCPANASGSDGNDFPFVKDGKLFSFSIEPERNITSDSLISINNYDFLNNSEGFAQKGVSVSKKTGWILAWNKKTQQLFHIDDSKRIRSKAGATGSLAYVDKKFILLQNSSFDESKGFGFTLYSIKYSWNGKKISLKQIWKGSADCFVSDCFFTDDGVCICGGTQDDTKHNAFYITAKGIHRCFSTQKNSDFLRILNTGDTVYAFLSGRDKTKVEPVLFSFTLEGYTEGNDAADSLSFYTSSIFSPDFDCFFGYGFVTDMLVIPASFDGQISFVCYDYKLGRIYSVVPDATGCVAVLGSNSNGIWYLARDPLIEDSFYGISLFTGTECKKIQEIY